MHNIIVRFLGLDLVVRDEDGNMINVDSVGVIDLYKRVRKLPYKSKYTYCYRPTNIVYVAALIHNQIATSSELKLFQSHSPTITHSRFSSGCCCTRKRFISSRYLLVKDGNAKTMCQICSQLTKKTPERRHWHCCGVFTATFELISNIVLVFTLLASN